MKRNASSPSSAKELSIIAASQLETEENCGVQLRLRLMDIIKIGETVMRKHVAVSGFMNDESKNKKFSQMFQFSPPSETKICKFRPCFFTLTTDKIFMRYADGAKLRKFSKFLQYSVK